MQGGCNFKSIIFKLILWIDISRASGKIVVTWMPQIFIDDKSTLVQTMAWCRQARGRRNWRPIVQNAILALSDKWLSLETRPMGQQKIIAQMNFVNLGQVTSGFGQLLMPCYLSEGRASTSQILRQPLQATSHYQSQSAPRTILSYGVTRPPCVK